jgi:hypothetical protein
MNPRPFLSGLLALFSLAAVCRADGDPFYYSTWYAQPSPALAWSSRSVTDPLVWGSTLSSWGPIDPGSPRFYYPGYGYLAPRRIFRTSLQDYGVAYGWGSRQPAMSVSGWYPSGGVAGFLPGTTWNLPPSAAETMTGTLHQPWYLPGSPGNYRPFQYNW